MQRGPQAGTEPRGQAATSKLRGAAWVHPVQHEGEQTAISLNGLARFLMF